LVGYGGYRYGLKKADFKATSRQNSTEKIDLSEFWLVWSKLEEKYLDKDDLQSDKMVEGAISGMVNSLGDPYTVYLPSEDNEISQENLSGSFGGVGIQLGYKDKQLAVLSPLKNTPAEKAGVEAGDYILKITDNNKDVEKTTEDISLPEAVKLIRGEIGNKVILTLSRESRPEPFDVEITRGEIEIPAIETSWESRDGKSYAHVHLLHFSQIMIQEWDEWVKEVEQKLNDPNFGGVVLDVRNNPGGYLHGATYVAEEFLQRGKTIVWQESYLGTKKEFSVQRSGKLVNVPLVVLINNGSASASEILAGALSQHQRAEIVGQTSFGKGTIQEPEQLPGNAGLHITTARWLLPNEKTIDDSGLEPDVKVEIPEEDELKSDEDLFLEKGVEQLIVNSE
jgi:carboxyl-terminal processing protease